MDWMAETPAAPRRARTRSGREVKSIVMLGRITAPPTIRWRALKARDRGAISVYARGRDYHDVLKGRLKQLAGFMLRAVPRRRDGQGLRRHGAGDGEAAGRRQPGSAGRASTPISSRAISAPGCFSARFSPTLELAPGRAESRSLRLVPRLSRRLPDRRLPGALSARRAALHRLSHHRAQGPDSREFRATIGNRIYGCDDCLAVCPWNKFAQATREAKLVAPRGPRRPAACRTRRGWTTRRFARVFAAVRSSASAMRAFCAMY